MAAAIDNGFQAGFRFSWKRKAGLCVNRPIYSSAEANDDAIKTRHFIITKAFVLWLKYPTNKYELGSCY